MNIFVGKICDFCSKPLPINFISTKCSKCPTVFDKCLTCCASSTQDYNICHKQHFTDNTKILKKEGYAHFFKKEGYAHFFKKIDFHFKEFLNIRKMNSLLKTFETPITECLRTFAQFLASRHSSIKDVDKELKAFLNDPKTVASKISAMKKSEDSEDSEQEVKTQMVDDEESEQVTKKKTIVLENESSSSSSEDSDESPKKAKASKKDADDSEAPDDEEDNDEKNEDEKEDASDASEPPAVEEDEEDEPKPKSKKAAAKAKPAPAPAAKAKAKGKTAKAASGEMELSDTPKLPVKDRPTLPKGIKFLKGTNNVVHNGVVVAAVSKKGLGKLTKTNIKPLEEKGIKYKEMSDAEIKKLFKISK